MTSMREEIRNSHKDDDKRQKAKKVARKGHHTLTSFLTGKEQGE